MQFESVGVLIRLLLIRLRPRKQFVRTIAQVDGQKNA